MVVVRALAWIMLLLVPIVAAPDLGRAGTIQLDLGTPLTITTSAADDVALATVVAAANTARRCSDGVCPDKQPPWRPETYLGDILRAALGAWTQAIDPERRACETYRALSDVEQRAIRTKTGGRSPCP